MPEKKIESPVEHKVAIVTGGTRGIGKAIAARLIAEGLKVAICGTRTKSVDDAVAALSAGNAGPGGEVFGMVADISRQSDVKRFVAAVRERFGSIGILVNNAGVGVFRSVADLAPEDWERMIGLNLSGVYYCCHEVLPIMCAAGGGDVINISSLAGKNAFAGGAGYNASKFGLNGFSEAMMLDHRNEGIRVSCIMPGSVDTEFGGEAGSDADWKIAPSDLAEVVVTLLKMPRRTMVSRVEIRPSRPGGKR
ncbi:MAG TPA: SDR family oxidoreductase [Bryobacteraceae bacterium]|jgi:NAD(P)-dependent dehydrogenase (short-subunit alcohol dehydrogenase family)|nr:SDR family oxidoreductase [Bryobacteraceae bacterium]